MLVTNSTIVSYRLIALACFVTVTYGQPISDSQTILPSPRASLTATLAQKGYQRGTSVDVTFTLTNVSNKPIYLIRSAVEWDYQLILTDSDGKEIERTQRGFTVANPGKEVGSPPRVGL